MHQRHIQQIFGLSYGNADSWHSRTVIIYSGELRSTRLYECKWRYGGGVWVCSLWVPDHILQVRRSWQITKSIIIIFSKKNFDRKNFSTKIFFVHIIFWRSETTYISWVIGQKPTIWFSIIWVQNIENLTISWFYLVRKW